MRGTRSSDYVEKLAALRLKWGGKCQDCGRRERYGSYAGHVQSNLQFSHVRATAIWGRGRGARERYLDVVRNPECYRLRCRKCHRAADQQAPRVSPEQRRAELQRWAREQAQRAGLPELPEEPPF